MFHEMTAFSASTEALMSRSETLLLTMLLSRWVVQDSTDLTSHIIWEKIEVVEIKVDERLMFWIDVFFLISENSKNFLWISSNN